MENDIKFHSKKKKEKLTIKWMTKAEHEATVQYERGSRNNGTEYGECVQ